MARKTVHWTKRLTAKIRRGKPNECWEFTGKSKTCGYGVLQMGAGIGTIMAHRLAFIMANGPIPPKMCVCHKCDNPACCNPNHLFLGTHSDNLLDMSRKNRHRGARKLTPAKVVRIRFLLKAGLRKAYDLAQEYRVDRSTISKLKHGHSWPKLRR